MESDPLDPLGEVLGVLLGAIGELMEPGATSVAINPGAPAEHRPLRLAAPGRQIDVHPAEMRDLSLGRDQNDFPALFVTFGPEVGVWLATATADHVGQPIAISVCGHEIVAPIVREPILGGRIVIAGDLEPLEWQAAMAAIAGQIDCAGRPLAEPATAPETAPRRGGSRGN